MKKFNEIQTIAVHDGVFHADDVLCVALINVLCKKTVEVIRSRDEDRLNQADIICDIGLGEFDHHDRDEAQKERYENGVMYAACGKVARAMVNDPDVDITQEELDMLLMKALYAVQAFDNGQDTKKDGIPNYPNPFSFISTFNNLQSNGGVYAPIQDGLFANATAVAETVLCNVLAQIREELSSKKMLQDCIANRHNHVIIMDTFIRGWQNDVVAFNDQHLNDMILMVVYPGRGSQWNIQVVPKNNDPADHEAWVGSLAGKTENLPGHVFTAHGFMSGFETKEQAIDAARLITEWSHV